jgi:cytochrome P450 family 142 subfamily A polypeptide 1
MGTDLLATLSPTRLTELEGERLDLLAPELHLDPYATYAWLRANRPVCWDPTNELWGVARYDDIVDIERQKELFVSSDQHKGGYRPNLPADPAMIGMDDPAHYERRSIVARRFTPRAAANWADEARRVVNELLDVVQAGGGTAEIVDQLAAPIPAMMIGKLLGFAPERWPDLKRWSETTIALGGGPRYNSAAGRDSIVEFATAAAELAEEKRRCPADDVMSVWTSASVGGQPMDPGMIFSDSLLLLDGGAETTRTVIARTLLALIDHPDQWQLLRNGADLTVAVEEFIRFVTPIHNMCRVAAEDVEVGGRDIQAGQQLVLMYTSANRDEAHFDDPEALDVTRHPNKHIAFGFGTHFCLGASLARMEIRVFFEELVRRVKDFRMTPGTQVEATGNAFVFGVDRAYLDFTFR